MPAEQNMGLAEVDNIPMALKALALTAKFVPAQLMKPVVLYATMSVLQNSTFWWLKMSYTGCTPSNTCRKPRIRHSSEQPMA